MTSIPNASLYKFDIKTNKMSLQDLLIKNYKI